MCKASNATNFFPKMVENLNTVEKNPKNFTEFI